MEPKNLNADSGMLHYIHFKHLSNAQNDSEWLLIFSTNQNAQNERVA